MMYDKLKTGRRISNERNEIDLSREQLAEQVGLSPYYIGQIERGNRSMSIETLIKISECLRISIDYLITGQEKTPEVNNGLQALVLKLSEREQYMVMDFIKTIIPYMHYSPDEK